MTPNAMPLFKVISRLRLLLPAAFLLLLLAACSSDRPQSTFGPAGPVADRQLSLFWLIFWLAVVVFVIVEGLLLYMIIRFRRRRGQEELPPQTHGNTALEVTWTIIPAFIIVSIAVPTYITIADQRNPPAGETLKVEVTAHQWWWEFQYPDLGVLTANELHIPVGMPVDITLRSEDVIHSFWVPKLAGKTDVTPNRANKMWFTALEPDTFYGQCGELCGIAHAQMRFRVISQTPDEFDRWVAAQRQPPKKPQGELALKGQQLFLTKGCVACHSFSGAGLGTEREAQLGRMKGFLEGKASFPAPNLTSFATRTTFAGGIAESNTESLLKWVMDPDNFKPGNRMAQLAGAYQDPSHPVTEEEARALVAYLQSLEPDLAAPTPTATAQAGTPTAPTPTAAAGDAAAGKQLFLQRGCTACHTVKGVPEATGAIGPELTGVAGRAGGRIPGVSAADYLRQSELQPGAFVVQGFAPLMPSGLVAEGPDLNNLIAYLSTLKE